MPSNRSGNDSFRFKLLSVLRVSLIAGLIVTGASVVVVQTYLSIDKLKADLEVVSNIIGDRSVAALVFNDSIAAAKNLQAAKFHPSLVSACLYRKNGNLFAYYKSVSTVQACKPNMEKPKAHKIRIDKGLFNHSLISIIEDSEQTQGWMVVDANAKDIQSTLFIFILLVTVALLMITTASAALANRLLDHVMEPLDDLHHTAVAVSNEILSKRRATKNSNDEVGELVDVFNRMLDSIASETRALTISEERFRTLTSNAPIGIFQIDREFNLEYANEKWQEITGISFKEGAFDKHKLNVIPDENFKVAYTNLKSKYSKDSKIKIRVKGRELYPLRTFAGTFDYDNTNHLPSTSYYQLEDYVTGEIIFPFGDYTKISCDANGSFFILNLSSLPINRTYLLKMKISQGGIDYIIDDKSIFEIV